VRNICAQPHAIVAREIAELERKGEIRLPLEQYRSERSGGWSRKRRINAKFEKKEFTTEARRHGGERRCILFALPLCLRGELYLSYYHAAEA